MYDTITSFLTWILYSSRSDAAQKSTNNLDRDETYALPTRTDFKLPDGKIVVKMDYVKILEETPAPGVYALQVIHSSIFVSRSALITRELQDSYLQRLSALSIVRPLTASLHLNSLKVDGWRTFYSYTIERKSSVSFLDKRKSLHYTSPECWLNVMKTSIALSTILFAISTQRSLLMALPLKHRYGH